jgi:hypothetical protein
MSKPANPLTPIFHLRRLARAGDQAAIEQLRVIGCAAANALNELVGFKDASQPVREVAGQSMQWPITIDAIQELHRGKAELVASDIGLGANTPIRTHLQGRGRPRAFHPHAAATFAKETIERIEQFRKPAQDLPPHEHRKNSDQFLKLLDEFEENGKGNKAHHRRMEFRWELMASLLPPLSDDETVISHWIETSLVMLESDCLGDWWGFPWPEPVRKRAAIRSRTDDDLMPRSMLREMLEQGFKALAKPS